MDNPVFDEITVPIFFQIFRSTWEGPVLKEKFEEKEYNVYIAPLPEKKRLNFLTTGIIGIENQTITVIQPSINPDEEISIGSLFPYKGKIWVIKEIQDWLKEGKYFRYYAFLKTNTIKKEQ